MTQQASLRQRKKQQTAQALWGAAIGLFLEHGFENVTVAQIAEAVDVSRMTVFNYFPTKEDLVLRPVEAHVGDAARIVRERPAGQPPVEALRRAFLAGLAERDAATGLSDAPDVLAVRRLLRDAPALAHRALRLVARDRELLAAELAGPHAEPDVLARVAAAQLVGIREELIAENVRRLLDGESADAVHPEACAAAEAAFAMAAHGLHRHLGRGED